ncbi:iron complex outermembrane receptor protein [Altererythrobacter atlanticus]|nr:TonB-dependent receptor [Croceibacterium atlanticum]MBB5733707.1 iron complex outermembrane receptor protein [Croceibacterium atlanticum]
MHSIFLRRLAAATAIIFPLAAQGQEAKEALPPAASPEASVGDPILVTARRRAETAQNIPLAISVIGSDRIDNTGSFNVGRLQQLTPALNFYSSNPRNSAVNIRGIGVPFGLTNDGFDQGVGIYVDDVYYSRIASATFDFLDVAQIEVLRGPQGTLYGKNTTAGAINITTRQPTFTLEGNSEISIGNLGFRQAKASVSGPLGETVAARIAVSGTGRHGTIRNIATGNRINEQDNIGLRGQILWQPADRLDLTLAGDFSTQNPECCGTVFVRTGATQRAAARQFEALAAAQDYILPSRNPFDRVTDVDADLNAGNEIGGVSLRARLDLGEGELTSISAWRYWDWLPANDRDYIGLPITTLSQNPSQQEQFTQEFRYNRTGKALDLLLGAFAFHQQVRTQGSQAQGPTASRWLINPANPLSQDPTVLDGLTATNDIRLDNTSLAFFGQVSWHVTDALTIQPGFRVNHDRKKGLYESVVTNGDGQLVTFASADPRIVAQRGVLSPQRFEPAFSDWNASYDLTVSYEVSPDFLVYGTYARSFKPGGVNLNGVPNDDAGNPILEVGSVAPEKVNHFELGLKAQGWDRRLTFNLAAFRTDIADYQALVVNGQIGVLRGYLANAESVRTQGIEWDIAIRPSRRFNAYLSGAYTDATYRRFSDAPCPPELSGGTTVPDGGSPSAPGTPGGFSPANCDISGQRLPGVSEWALSFGAEANAPARLFGETGEIYLGYDGSWRSDFSSNASPSRYTWVNGYSLSNFRAGYRSDAGFEIFGWLRNAFDQNYFEQLSVPSGNTGLIVGQPGDPRTYGFTIQHRF